MEGKTSAEVFQGPEENIRCASGKDHRLPLWLFQHQELVQQLHEGHPVDKETLINALNYIHFMEKSVLVHLRDPEFRDSILVRAFPEPCLGGELVCHWAERPLSDTHLDRYEFYNLVIADGRSITLVPAVLEEMSPQYIRMTLPDTGHAAGQREARRHPCGEVAAELDQNGFVARGKLLDFSPIGFRARVKPDAFSSFHWFNRGEPVAVHLRDSRQIFFTGACRCIRQRLVSGDMEIVLAPRDERIQRFKPTETRNPRQRLVPSPTLIFEHPLLGKRVQFEVSDISTSGFSVYENHGEGTLMAGMIIPDMVITFAHSMKMSCSAQVIYRLREEGGRVRCGLAILDMGIQDYSRLTHLLSCAMDAHSHVSTEVDVDALWEFFFKSGFIYPKKYGLIQSHRESFKETYQKLYQQCPEVARHFTYQQNGRIYGHIAMVRAYERTWMIHHHAATALEHKRAGLVVLKQIMHYLNDMHRLPSSKMDYVMSYFRPENKFPERVFGGFARISGDPRICSMDLFSYLPYTRLSLSSMLPKGWELGESTEMDIWELNRFYTHRSGGLLLDAMALEWEDPRGRSLETDFAKAGFLRKQRAYSLRRDGRLAAVLVVDQSDLGFNLSELLNDIKIFVINGAALPWHILSIGVSRLTADFRMHRVPVLFYPFDYVEREEIPYEKQYQAWVLNVRHGAEYMEYMRKKFRIKYE